MRQYSERLFDNSCKDTLPFLSSVSKTERFLHVVRSCVTLRGVRLEGSRGRPFGLSASGRRHPVILSEAKDLRDPSAFRPQGDRKKKASGRPLFVFLIYLAKQGKESPLLNFEQKIFETTLKQHQGRPCSPENSFKENFS